MSQLTDFRRQLDEFFAGHPQSPLTSGQKEDFDGLSYFEPNPDLALEVEIERFDDDEPLVEMETNTGERRLQRRWGRFRFTVEGEEASLVIYTDPDGDDFFMPFRDATSGKETYGAGRYMDSHRPGLERLGENQMRVDFNYAYNPYCAYNPHFSCPLPPRDNWLEVPIRAGEKDFE